MFLLGIFDHYQIFAIVPINCSQKQILVKFRDHSVQNFARLRLEIKFYFNNRCQINEDVSSNINNFCVLHYIINSNCCPINK